MLKAETDSEDIGMHVRCKPFCALCDNGLYVLNTSPFV